jgi:hypothetical protein
MRATPSPRADDVSIAQLPLEDDFATAVRQDALGQAFARRDGPLQGLDTTVDDIRRWPNASAQRLENRNTDNAISLNDAIERVSAAKKLPNDGVTAIEMRLRRMRDEELLPPVLGTGQRHAERAPHVPRRLISSRMAYQVLRCRRLCGRHPAPQSWVRHDETLPSKVFRVRKRDDVVRGERRLSGVQHQLQRSVLRLNKQPWRLPPHSRARSSYHAKGLAVPALSRHEENRGTRAAASRSSGSIGRWSARAPLHESGSERRAVALSTNRQKTNRASLSRSARSDIERRNCGGEIGRRRAAHQTLQTRRANADVGVR